jgi:predicted lipid-binding transport protein (Tim44 family)
MSDRLDIYTILFLVLAVFILLRLRSVLGTRTGSERPPYARVSALDAKPAAKTNGDNVVALPGRAPEPDRPVPAVEPAPDRWTGITEPDTPLAHQLDAVVAADPTFEPRHFLTGAKAAYEMIVNAFAQGDQKTLKQLLSPDVFDNFSSVIEERERRGETVQSSFVSIDKADIVGAEFANRTAQITVRFVSKLISATRDRSGKIIDGNPEKVTDVTDVWTFARDTSTRDPNWKLIATEAT